MSCSLPDGHPQTGTYPASSSTRNDGFGRILLWLAVQSCGEVDRLSGYLCGRFLSIPWFFPWFQSLGHQYEARIMVGGGNSFFFGMFTRKKLRRWTQFWRAIFFQDGLCKPPTSCLESLSLRYVKEGLRSSAMGRFEVGEDEHHWKKWMTWGEGVDTDLQFCCWRSVF